MKLTNMQIYNYANALAGAFADFNQRLPVKVSFYLQKNKTVLMDLAQDIEKARIEIIQAQGKLNAETNQYDIPDEKMQDVMNDLNELFEIEQEVNIHTFNIDDFGNTLTTTPQFMEAIMFMLED